MKRCVWLVVRPGYGEFDGRPHEIWTTRAQARARVVTLNSAWDDIKPFKLVRMALLGNVTQAVEAARPWWVVSKFDPNTLIGTVQRGRVKLQFHSTSFCSDTALRWPRKGEQVQVILNNSDQLLSVHGK